MNDKTVARKVYFYRTRFWTKKVDEPKEATFKDVAKAFRRVNDLDFETGARYLERDDGNALSMVVCDIGDDAVKGKLGIRRLRDLPMLEKSGEEYPLELDPDACLFEPFHFILFPNGVLGAEFNFFGPRVSALREYLIGKMPDLIFSVELELLLRRDVHEILKRMGEIKLFEMAIHRDGVQLVEKLDTSLASAFKACLETSGDSELIEITLRSKPYSRKPIRLPLRKRLGNWIVKPENREITEQLKLRGRNETTGKVEWFDLLEDKLISTRQVLKPDTEQRYIDSRSMLKAIEDAYIDLEKDILMSIGS